MEEPTFGRVTNNLELAVVPNSQKTILSLETSMGFTYTSASLAYPFLIIVYDLSKLFYVPIIYFVGKN